MLGIMKIIKKAKTPTKMSKFSDFHPYSKGRYGGNGKLCSDIFKIDNLQFKKYK